MLLESITEGSKNVRHLPRYLSIQRDPEVLFRISSLGPCEPVDPQEAPILELLKRLAA